MKNILVVNVNWLGDVIFSTPVFKALKKFYPGARVSCLAVPRVKDVLEQCPFIDEVIVYDEKGSHWSPLGKFQIIMNLRREKFDVVFLLHRSMSRALLMFLAGIPERVGYDTKKQSRFLTHKVSLKGEPLHRSDEYIKVVEDYGVSVDDRMCELKVDSEVLTDIDHKLLRSGITPKDRLIIVNPGGNWDLKRWPAENFSELTKRLVKENGAKVLISGGKDDLTLANGIAGESQVDPCVWAGKTGLSELLALFKRADVVVSSDSGPSHVAASVGTDVVAIFGPTRPEITAPRGHGRVVVLHKEIGCNKAPCYHLTCPRNECMRAITVDDVLQAIQKFKR
jgi:lipopolysaccharide heptosyltransferase II